MGTVIQISTLSEECDTPSSRLLAALDLMELGFALKRQGLRRSAPNASEEEIDERLQSWILE